LADGPELYTIVAAKGEGSDSFEVPSSFNAPLLCRGIFSEPLATSSPSFGALLVSPNPVTYDGSPNAMV